MRRNNGSLHAERIRVPVRDLFENKCAVFAATEKPANWAAIAVAQDCCCAAAFARFVVDLMSLETAGIDLRATFAGQTVSVDVIYDVATLVVVHSTQVALGIFLVVEKHAVVCVPDSAPAVAWTMRNNRAPAGNQGRSQNLEKNADLAVILAVNETLVKQTPHQIDAQTAHPPASAAFRAQLVCVVAPVAFAAYVYLNR